jgi:uncharacterized protein (TIGR00251 family)
LRSRVKKAKTNRPQDKADQEPALLAVRIQPRASKNEIIPMEGGAFKIRLTAPPVDGAANEALVKFLSDVLGIAKSRIMIISGETSREKRIRISGMSEAEVRRLLNSKAE